MRETNRDDRRYDRRTDGGHWSEDPSTASSRFDEDVGLFLSTANSGPTTVGSDGVDASLTRKV